MSATVTVIASCSDRKRERERAIRLRDVGGGRWRSRVTRWWRALQSGRGDDRGDKLMSARRLYQGEHWSVVRELDRGGPLGAPSGALAGELTGNVSPCELWVASAGYGLVAIDARLHPYAATFATQHADSVAISAGDGPRAKEENQAWWQALTAQSGPDVGAPRSVSALAAARPHNPLIIVGSPGYINAMERDLLAARQELDSPDRLIIVSSAPPSECRMKANWVTTSARLQPIVGGSLISLNARIARKILRDHAVDELRASRLRALLAKATAKAPPRARTARKTVTDAQVARFIRQELAADPRQTHTRLLKLLRAGGWSCEQSRFKRIYQQIR